MENLAASRAVRKMRKQDKDSFPGLRQSTATNTVNSTVNVTNKTVSLLGKPNPDKDSSDRSDRCIVSSHERSFHFTCVLGD